MYSYSSHHARKYCSHQIVTKISQDLQQVRVVYVYSDLNKEVGRKVVMKCERTYTKCIFCSIGDDQTPDL